MPYTIPWSTLIVDGSTVDAEDIDEKLTNIKTALEERFEEVLIEDAEDDPWVLKDTAGGPVTGKRLLISHPDFIPHDVSTSAMTLVGWNVAGDSDMLCPIKLPPSTVITQIEIFLERLSNTVTWEFYRYQHTAAAPTQDLLATGSTAAGSYQILDSGVIGVTVATNYYYALVVYSSSGLASHQFRLHGARITYNSPSAKETM